MNSDPALQSKRFTRPAFRGWLLLAICFPLWLLAQNPEEQKTDRAEEDFGKVFLQFNQAAPETFSVDEAVLYKEVAIRFDTTAILQNDGGFTVYFYPQLYRGTHYVLRMMLRRPAGKKGGGFFDVYYDLGDTLVAPLDIQDSTATVYFSANGQLLSFKPLARNFRGHFELVPGEKAKTVTGRFDTEFDYPLSAQRQHFAHVKIWGTLTVPAGKLHEVNLETLAYKKQRQKSFRRNVGVALIFIAIIIFFVGS
ncbi:MAG: hypothetical protein D6715_00540 [Calditrichaeota bacterium]|nr:MAG: hypothetical protein D6715_00540 [Calditrichota bacterium]